MWLIAVALVAASGCSRSPREVSPREQAAAAVDAGRWESALEAIDRLIDGSPEDAQLWVLRGRAMLGSGDAAGAKSDLSEAIRLAPDEPEAYYYRGLALAELGDRAAARADRLRARQLDPEVEKAYLFAPKNSRPLLANGGKPAAADQRYEPAAADQSPAASAAAATTDNEPGAGLAAPALVRDRDAQQDKIAASSPTDVASPDVFFREDDDTTLTEQVLGLRLETVKLELPQLWTSPRSASAANLTMTLPAEPRATSTLLPRLSPPLKSHVTGQARPRPQGTVGSQAVVQRNAAADRRNGRTARLRSGGNEPIDEADEYDPARYGRQPPRSPFEPPLPPARPFGDY